MKMTDTGKCLCGAITFEAHDVEKHFHACHCSMCRKWAGGPGFGVSVGSLELSGEDQLGVYRSSEWGNLLAKFMLTISQTPMTFRVAIRVKRAPSFLHQLERRQINQ